VCGCEGEGVCGVRVVGCGCEGDGECVGVRMMGVCGCEGDG